MSGVIPLKEYASAIKTMAGRCGAPVIDAYNESGIVSYFEVNSAPGRYLADGLHPSGVGKLKMGDYFTIKISSINP
jgi:hypothetical protein